MGKCVGTAMKYAKLEVLSDTPLRKFLYIRIESDRLNEIGSKITQISNVSLNNPRNPPQGLITVAVKGAQLPYTVLQGIVQDYLTGKLQFQNDFRFSIREE
jgi:hypothetical protein